MGKGRGFCRSATFSAKWGDFLKKTQAYQLNQWDEDDRIMREDFNADNAKIDAAITEVRAENPYRLIRSVTTTAEAGQIDVDVSDIDFTKYLKIELFFHSPDYGNSLMLRINNISSESYAYGFIGGQGGAATQYDTQMAYFYQNGRGILAFYTPTRIEPVMCATSTYYNGNYSGLQHAAPCTWAELKTLNLIGGDKIPVGTVIKLYGVIA